MSQWGTETQPRPHVGSSGVHGLCPVRAWEADSELAVTLAGMRESSVTGLCRKHNSFDSSPASFFWPSWLIRTLLVGCHLATTYGRYFNYSAQFVPRLRDALKRWGCLGFWNFLHFLKSACLKWKRACCQLCLHVWRSQVLLVVSQAFPC